MSCLRCYFLANQTKPYRSSCHVSINWKDSTLAREEQNTGGMATLGIKKDIQQTYKEIYLILLDVLGSTTYSGSTSSSKVAQASKGVSPKSSQQAREYSC